jgi:hypothetical protein
MKKQRYKFTTQIIDETKCESFIKITAYCPAQYQIGAINRDDAVAVVLQYITHANHKGKELSKHYGMTFKPISIWGFLR